MGETSLERRSSNQHIQVLGIGAAAAAHIVQYLAQYTAEMVGAGLTGVIMEIEKTKMTIRFEKKQARVNYGITIREEIARKISRALDRIEGHPEIRPEIQDMVKQELYEDLGVFFREVRQELSRAGF